MHYALLALLAGALFAIGMALQKHAVSGRGFRAETLLQPVWLLGSLLLLVAVGVQAQAFSQGDVSVAEPLVSSEAAFALLIGSAVLGERMH